MRYCVSVVLSILCVAARRGQEECKGREGGKNLFALISVVPFGVDILVNR